MTFSERLLAQQSDEHVVVTLPGEIDLTNSSGVREALFAAVSRQPALVVADMTATTFCDSSGIHAITAAYQRAIAAGTDLRLVISHPTPRRVFQLCGVDTFISIYLDLPAALSG
jgi:anti-sigma B factor antagonist